MANERVLTGALRRTFNMLREDAEATAKVVSEVFRGEEEVNDEDLDKELRALFYTLEQQNLLGVRRTEYKFEGQTRRAYFWHLKEITDDELDRGLGGLSKEEVEAMRVYRAIPTENWARQKN